MEGTYHVWLFLPLSSQMCDPDIQQRGRSSTSVAYSDNCHRTPDVADSSLTPTPHWLRIPSSNHIIHPSSLLDCATNLHPKTCPDPEGWQIFMSVGKRLLSLERSVGVQATWCVCRGGCRQRLHVQCYSDVGHVEFRVTFWRKSAMWTIYITCSLWNATLSPNDFFILSLVVRFFQLWKISAQYYSFLAW